jgi:hypothetical protein
LLVNDVNERSISHRLALYLEPLFPGWQVDCEYNRDFARPGRPKSLHVPDDNVGWDDTDARTVYPDIIVHSRGSDDNLLVLELKKTGLSTSFDEAKLYAYKRELGYKFSYLLVVRTGATDPGFESPRMIVIPDS